MSYWLCQTLLDRGYALEFPEPGGNNKQGCRLERILSHESSRPQSSVRRTQRTESKFMVKDAADMIVRAHERVEIHWRLQLKTFPQTGSKRGATTLNGFAKDLNYVKQEPPQTSAFIFVADEESYASIRGQRRGPRGPKATRKVYDLPDMPSAGIIKDDDVEGCSGRFRSFHSSEGIIRTAGVIWRET